MDISSGYMDFCLAGRQHHWYLTHLHFFFFHFSWEKQARGHFWRLKYDFFPCCAHQKKIYVLNYSDYLFQQFHLSLTSFPWIHTVLQNFSLIPGKRLWDRWMIHIPGCNFLLILVTHLHANSAPLQTGLKWAYICSILGCT